MMTRMLARSSRLPLAAASTQLQRSFARPYRGHNRIEDIMSASEAWHSLAPNRPLNDEAALRETFTRLDLDGSGKIDAYELRTALLEMQASFDPFETPFGPEIDAKVDEMIAWADTDDDGLISFDEYKKVIEAGCSPTGKRANAESKDDASGPTHVHVGRPPPSGPPDPDTIYL